MQYDIIRIIESEISNKAWEMVRVKSNPDFPEDKVNKIKMITAYLITFMQNELAGDVSDPRCCSEAITQYEGACHWAVKAVTAPPREII